MKSKTLRILSIFLLPILLMSGYYLWFKIPPTNRQYIDAAHGIKLEWLQGYSALEYIVMLKLAGINAEIKSSYNVDVYRITYPSTNAHFEQVDTQGLIVIPRKAEHFRGIVSWQHGTVVDAIDLPSSGGLYNGIFPTLLFATGGYITLAPDYIGYEQANPEYLHSQSEANAVLDLIKATQIILPQIRTAPLDPAIYLTGFSQGGHVSLAALKYNHDPQIKINALASIAGPFAFVKDQENLAFKNALFGNKGSHTLYMAFLAHSYAFMYDMSLSELINEKHLSTVAALFDGQHTNDEIMAWIDSDAKDIAGVKAREIFTESFLNDFQAWEQGRTTQMPWLISRLLENSVLDQEITIPVRLYAGQKDMDVPIAEAVNAVKQWGNPNVTLIDLGNLAHMDSAIKALPQIRIWFDELTNSD